MYAAVMTNLGKFGNCAEIARLTPDTVEPVSKTSSTIKIPFAGYRDSGQSKTKLSRSFLLRSSLGPTLIVESGILSTMLLSAYFMLPPDIERQM